MNSGPEIAGNSSFVTYFHPVAPKLRPASMISRSMSLTLLRVLMMIWKNAVAKAVRMYAISPRPTMMMNSGTAIFGSGYRVSVTGRMSSSKVRHTPDAIPIPTPSAAAIPNEITSRWIVIAISPPRRPSDSCSTIVTTTSLSGTKKRGSSRPIRVMISHTAITATGIVHVCSVRNTAGLTRCSPRQPATAGGVRRRRRTRPS